MSDRKCSVCDGVTLTNSNNNGITACLACGKPFPKAIATADRKTVMKQCSVCNAKTPSQLNVDTGVEACRDCGTPFPPKPSMVERFQKDLWGNGNTAWTKSAFFMLLLKEAMEANTCACQSPESHQCLWFSNRWNPQLDAPEISKQQTIDLLTALLQFRDFFSSQKKVGCSV